MKQKSEPDNEIDVIDENLIRELAARMKVSAHIGEVKKAHNVAIIQAGRWEQVLAKADALAAQYGLDPKFVKAVFEAIHEASVDEQNKTM